MSLFGRRKRTALDILNGATWNCGNCGVEHEGMFDLAAAAPDHWEGEEVYEPNSALRLDGDFLSEDFCVLGGEHFFVRCVFDIPVHGMAEKFGFGAWSTLSRANFEKYVEGFDDGRFAGIGPWTGWFSNSLKPFPSSVNEPCWVHPQLGRQRPTISLQNDAHELAILQLEGSTPERVLEIYAANGHGPR